MSSSARFTVLVAGGVFAASALAGPASSRVAPPSEGGKARPIVMPPGGGGGADGPGFVDNFDSYANGSALVPQGGWLLWDGIGGAPPASQNATVNNALAASAPNSVTSVVETDMVQLFNITSGRWICKVKTYVPTGATGTGYFLLLNQFVHPYTSGGNWSIQVNFTAATNLVTSFNRSTINGGPGNTTATLRRDEWVELVIDINLDTDSFTMTYGGAPLVTNLGQWSFNTSNVQGSVAIQCIDLYSQMVGFRWDDVSLLPLATPPACYANCDASTTIPCLNVLDFGCFLNAFAAGNTYANCDASTTPPVLNVLDFGCFLNRFAAGCSSC